MHVDIFVKMNIISLGTEDGKIYKCSKAYSTHYLDVYEVSIISLMVLLLSLLSKSIIMFAQDFKIILHMP